MLSLIVPGKRRVKKMDVYLAPFIDEMQLLWKGIKMYDISLPPSNKSFMFMVYCVGQFTISRDLVYVQVRKLFYNIHT